MTNKVQDSFLLPGESLERTGESLIIYSSPGAGKTSLIKTLLGWEGSTGDFFHEPYCKPEEILVLDVESGRKVLCDKENKLCVTVKPIDENATQFREEFKKMVSFLLEDKHPFKFVFLDNVSELEKYFVFNLAKKRGKPIPEIKEWGDASNYLRIHLRDLLKVTHRGMNIILNFWDMADKIKDVNGEILSVICPMCMSKTWKEYVGLVEHSAYMGISPKSGKRFLQFETHGMIQAKTRCFNLGQGVGKFVEANLSDIFRTLGGGNDA